MNLNIVNSMFTEIIPVGILLLIIIGIYILSHLKRLFNFYKVCRYNKYYNGIVVNLCIYLIVLSVVLSFSFEDNNNLIIDLDNKIVGLNNKVVDISSVVIQDKVYLSPKDQKSIDDCFNSTHLKNEKYSGGYYSIYIGEVKLLYTINDVLNYYNKYSALTYSNLKLNDDMYFTPFVVIRSEMMLPDNTPKTAGIIRLCDSKGKILYE